MNMKQISAIAGVLLILAIPSGLWPYDYYVLLRWVIAGSALALAYYFYESKKTSWTLIFGSVAFLFNPIAPIYLAKQTWVIIDMIVAVLFFISTKEISKSK